MLLAACMLPAALVAGIALWTSFRDGRDALVQHAQVEARAMSRSVDDVLRHAASGLKSLAATSSLQAGDLRAFEEQARRVLPYQDGNNVVLTDIDGQQLVNTLVPRGQPLPRHGQRAFQQRVIRSGEAAVSDLFIGGALRRPLVAVEVPVWRGDRVAYTLAMGFLPERFTALLTADRPESGWIVAICDAAGTIVARTHESERFVGQKVVPQLLEAIARQPEGAVELDTLEGVPVYAVYSRSPTTGWTVAVGVPRAVLLARLQRWTAWLVVSLTAVLLIGVWVARAIALRIAGAIRSLVEPANALGEGRPVELPAPEVEEAAAVASAIGRAADLLRSRTSERDQAAQTAALMHDRARRLSHAAQHDPLTDLHNRAAFRALLAERLHERASGAFLTVMFVDLDDFKPVNDRYGHAVGDDLLRAFSKRLRSCVREGDFVARVGGDEFALLIDGHGPGELESMAREMAERLSQPYHVRHVQIRVSASIGAAGFPEHGRSADALLEAADAAMYESKRKGKGRFSMSAAMPL